MKERERFSSRLGFILISAGCASGLGNGWRFPYIAGQYGGAAFGVVYLFFLIVLGLPVLTMEFSVGRASRKSVASSFRILEPKGTKWHIFSYFAMAGNYLLMMFYTTGGGWMLAYFFKMAGGAFENASPGQIEEIFNALTARPLVMTVWLALVIALSFGICSFGLQKGVERVTKGMMSCLLLIMLALVLRAVTLPAAAEGLRFYLMPDFGKMAEAGIFQTVFAAMGQAFFTLSIGVGSMAIFGSYIGKERSLFGEAMNVLVLDTAVAVMAGLIIFPACFSFGINPGSGPRLVFVTLPNVFNSMGGGRIWGTLFFLFMTFAAMSTIVAVFENVLSFAMDLWGWSRKKAVLINTVLVMILSLPCVLGFNILSGFHPLGAGTNIMDLEDFIVSNNLLPIGAMVYVCFCVSKRGWGWDGFLVETNTGRGLKFPAQSKVYVKYVLPLIILFIFVQGYISFFRM